MTSLWIHGSTSIFSTAGTEVPCFQPGPSLPSKLDLRAVRRDRLQLVTATRMGNRGTTVDGCFLGVVWVIFDEQKW